MRVGTFVSGNRFLGADFSMSTPIQARLQTRLFNLLSKVQIAIIQATVTLGLMAPIGLGLQQVNSISMLKPRAVGYSLVPQIHAPAPQVFEHRGSGRVTLPDAERP
jgi:hypothetical protein